MNTYRTALSAAALLLAASAASAERAAIGQKIREVPNAPVEVAIWTDRGEDASYCDGDSIEIYFRTNVDAYVAIYDVDTTGRIHRLFPSRYAHDNFVRGGDVNRVPARYGFHFEVEGPRGWETLRAVAATDPRDLELYSPANGPASYPITRPFESTAAPVRSAPDRPGALLNKIREVPDAPTVAIDEARHYVRDGYSCRPRPNRPWWLPRR